MAAKKAIDRLFWELITTSRDVRAFGAKLEEATTARDNAIHRAWAEGISARAIADFTQLSHARIQQIVYDREDRAERALGLQPALRQRRQDRERSRMLLAHFEAQQDNALNGIRERAQRGVPDDKLSSVVGVARDLALSWPEIAEALGTEEQAARERFGWLDQQPTRQSRVG